MGKIIWGMTREEIAAHIKQELQFNDLIKDPVVLMEFMNLNIKVLGKGNNLGRFNIDSRPKKSRRGSSRLSTRGRGDSD